MTPRYCEKGSCCQVATLVGIYSLPNGVPATLAACGKDHAEELGRTLHLFLQWQPIVTAPEPVRRAEKLPPALPVDHPIYSEGLMNKELW